jgi:DnaJ-class molecular chaperone
VAAGVYSQGIDEGSSQENIKRAFHTLSMQHRSTKNHLEAAFDATDSDGRYDIIVAAYDVLRDPLSRALYDCCGARAVVSAETIRCAWRSRSCVSA